METINPFLDRKVAEFMFGIPYHLKIKKGVTKYLLRLSMKNILPETTRTRIKNWLECACSSLVYWKKS